MKVAIVGGAGKMGQWLTRFMLNEGMDVIVVDINKEKLNALEHRPRLELTSDIKSIIKSDVIILAVPLINFDSVVMGIAPLIRREHLIFDIASIKKTTIDSIHKHIKYGTVLGIHPMFGPGVTDINGQNIILTPTSDAEQNLAGKVTKYLEVRGAKVTAMLPSAHDEIMSIILGLSHFIALVTADTLADLCIIKDIEKYGGTTFKRLLELVTGVISEDPGFYSYLQTNLPGLSTIYSVLQNKVGRWADLVKDGDRHQISRQMIKLQKQYERKR